MKNNWKKRKSVKIYYISVVKCKLFLVRGVNTFPRTDMLKIKINKSKSKSKEDEKMFEYYQRYYYKKIILHCLN